MATLLAESWTWYAFAVLIFVARFISRWLHLRSVKRFQAEDYVMVLVFAFYTTLIAAMNVVSHLDTNLMLPEDIPNLTPESIVSRIRGSKYVIVVEQSMIITIWGCKICLLLLYRKLTFGLKQQWMVEGVAAYVVINFIVMEGLYLGYWCRPFNQLWAVPVENTQCSTQLNHLIMNAVFNISSDLMMLCIPLPLLITSKLPRAKKFILCILFSLGVFVILCAVLNKYYSFAHPFSPMWMFWYIREASTAVYVANMPMCWPLMRRIFNLRSFNGSASQTRSKSHQMTSQRGTGARVEHGTIVEEIPRRNASKNDTGSSSRRGDRSWWDREGSMHRITRSESEEYIVDPTSAKPMPLEVWETKEFEIDRGSMRIPPQAALSDGPMRMYDGTQDGSNTFETTTVVTAAKGRKSESNS